QNEMERLHDIISLTVLAGMVATTISAVIGVTSLCIQGSADWTSFGLLWFEWWIGDMLGILVMTPFMLTWCDKRSVFPEIKKSPWKAFEAVSLFVFLTVLVESMFGGWLEVHLRTYLRSFIFPFLIWIAIRFGHKGATAAIITVSMVATRGTIYGRGPFV